MDVLPREAVHVPAAHERERVAAAFAARGQLVTRRVPADETRAVVGRAVVVVAEFRHPPAVLLPVALASAAASAARPRDDAHAPVAVHDHGLVPSQRVNAHRAARAARSRAAREGR
eukprot:31500-Pelagococcus_subviridis.AAC.11